MTPHQTLRKPQVYVWLCIALILLLPSYTSFAQNEISGSINSYTAVTSFDDCANKVTVNNPAALQPNGVVLIIQMQGASISEANNASFGTITNYNGAGFYEKAVIATVNGNDITFTKNLVNIYNPAGKVQMVTVPQYQNVLIRGPLTAAPWNGTTGGVLAFEASGTVVLNADINVDGKGFRGGGITINRNNNCPIFPFAPQSNRQFYERNSWEGAFKGEGIAEAISGKELGQGPQANGGGGGNDHNSGGGGGANSATGGKGGENIEPFISNQCRGMYPGLGGRPLDISNRIFMGGGGGGGHSNNINSGTPGGNGGGIIYITANAFNGNGKVISANGISALDGSGDGVGGGGAGGTILLNVNEFTPEDLTVEARGGNGANVNNLADQDQDRCFGPGGGGGGGVVAISAQKFPEDVIRLVSGGLPGRGFNSKRGGCNNSNGALTGGNGVVLQSVTIPAGILDPVASCNPLPVDFIYFKAQAGQNNVELEWATAREVNNKYFSVERSEDGVHFYEIAQISGKGTFTGVSTYTMADNNPMYGLSYYRIKQVDNDQEFAYSSIVSVEYNVSDVLLSIFPNPVQIGQILNAKIYMPVEGIAQIRIFDMLGEEVQNVEIPLIKGTQTVEIDMTRFTSGLYVVHLQSNSFYKTQKIKVVR